MEYRYLFKAKRTDNGEWVTGSLITCEDGTCKIATRYLDDSANIAILICVYDVDGDTICQCTGLKDKNGKLIWENDIIKLHQFLFDGSEYEKEILISIEYMSEMMCFGANLIEAKEIKRYMGYKDEDTEKVVVPFNDFYGLHEESFEVIGNIFDNKELLESEG